MTEQRVLQKSAEQLPKFYYVTNMEHMYKKNMIKFLLHLSVEHLSSTPF